MKEFKTSFGKTVDLDDESLYIDFPTKSYLLDDLMFKEIGFALCYMKFIHPDIFSHGIGKQQKKRVKKLIQYFVDNRINKIECPLWVKQQIYIFQDEIENMC